MVCQPIRGKLLLRFELGVFCFTDMRNYYRNISTKLVKICLGGLKFPLCNQCTNALCSKLSNIT